MVRTAESEELVKRLLIVFVALQLPAICVAEAPLQPLRVGHAESGSTKFSPPALLGMSSADSSKPAVGFRPPDPRWRDALVLAVGGALVATYGLKNWWDEGFTGEFRTRDEGWFGPDTASGGADKLGHAYSSYTGTRLLARGFEAMGDAPEHSRRLGLWSSIAIMTAVEVADGFSRQHRFSSQDVVMNVLGAGMGYLLEGNPALDRLIDLRLLYRPSPNSDFDPAGDYSGQTYLFVLKGSGVPALRTHAAARYLELAVGYGSRGYDNPADGGRSRNLYVGISLNLSEVLNRVLFRGAREKSIGQRSSELVLEFIQLPGTAALYRHRL